MMRMYFRFTEARRRVVESAVAMCRAYRGVQAEREHGVQACGADIVIRFVQRRPRPLGIVSRLRSNLCRFRICVRHMVQARPLIEATFSV